MKVIVNCSFFLLQVKDLIHHDGLTESPCSSSFCLCLLVGQDKVCKPLGCCMIVLLRGKSLQRVFATFSPENREMCL